MSSNNYSFEVRWSDSDRGYIATCPEFPDLSAFGETAKEAIEEADVALSLFVDTYKDEGIPLPEPRTVVEFSGQLRLRMPKGLHARLSALAETESVSLNQMIVAMLSEAAGAGDLLRRFEASLDNRIAELTSQTPKPKRTGREPGKVDDAPAVRIYPRRRAQIDHETLDKDFIQRVVESLTRDQQDRLLGQQVLPLEFEIDQNRGILQLIFATPDPMRPETLKLIHELQLHHVELRYAPESEIVPIIEELFPIRASSNPAKYSKPTKDYEEGAHSSTENR